MLKIYLCGPINGCDDEAANGWRWEVKNILGAKRRGDNLFPHFHFIDPMRRDYRGMEMTKELSKKIVAGDIEDINESDLVLAMHPGPSSGTDMEIFYSWRVARTPVVTILPAGAPVSPWVVHHSDVIVPTLKAALSVIMEFEARIAIGSALSPIELIGKLWQ